MDPRLSHTLVAVVSVLGTVAVYEVTGGDPEPASPAVQVVRPERRTGELRDRVVAEQRKRRALRAEAAGGQGGGPGPGRAALDPERRRGEADRLRERIQEARAAGGREDQRPELDEKLRGIVDDTDGQP